MSALHFEALRELNELIQTTFGMSATKVITRAVKMARYDWRDLLQLEESGGTGLEFPMVVVRQKLTQEEDWGLAVRAESLPVDIILVHKNDNRIDTACTNGFSGTNQAVLSSAGMFVGQYLWFDTANQWRRVASIPDSTHVTVDVSISTATGERIMSETLNDINVRLEALRDALNRGTAHDNFQITEEGKIDVTDYNYVNQVFLGANYPLLGGILSTSLLIGETYA